MNDQSVSATPIIGVRRRICLAGTAMIALAGVTGCASPSRLDPAKATELEVASTLPAPDIADIYTTQREARLGPGDRLAVTVLNAADLNGDYIVDGDGNIRFPLIGTTPALGLTVSELGRTLEDRLEVRYLRNPQVMVTARELVSQRLTVLGAVGQPGRYPTDGRTTLRDALAQARGINEYGSPKEIVVFRSVAGKRMAARFNLNEINAGQAPDPVLFPNDQIFVATARDRQLLRDLAPLTPLAGIFYQIL